MTRVVAVKTRIVWATTTQQARNGGGDGKSPHPNDIKEPHLRRSRHQEQQQAWITFVSWCTSKTPNPSAGKLNGLNKQISSSAGGKEVEREEVKNRVVCP